MCVCVCVCVCSEQSLSRTENFKTLIKTAEIQLVSRLNSSTAEIERECHSERAVGGICGRPGDWGEAGKVLVDWGEAGKVLSCLKRVIVTKRDRDKDRGAGEMEMVSGLRPQEVKTTM